MMRAVNAGWPTAAVLVSMLVLWGVAVAVFQPPQYLVPGPIQVLHALSEHWDALSTGLLYTASAALKGFLLSAFIGIVLGSVFSSSRFLMRGFYPIAMLLQMVPLVAIAPVILIWCGYGETSVIACAVVVSVFPVLAATLDGLRSTDRGMVELFETMGATRLQRWRKLEMPGAIPNIVTGLRIAAGLAVIGTIVGEFVGAFGGNQAPLGIIIMSAIRENRTDLVFAAVALAALVGFALFGAVSGAGWLLLRRWHDSARERS